MATSTETRLRRGTASQIDAMTPAADEPISDTTYNRLRMGDGATVGGIPLPNYKDIQNETFSTGTVGGTGNAITLTLTPALFGYAAGGKVKFTATNNNSGATTIDVDTHGTRNIYKADSTGTLVTLSGGEIVAGNVYELNDDGTRYQLLNPTISIPSGGPDVGTLVTFSSTNSIILTVDFTTYYSYKIYIYISTNVGATLLLDASSNGGSGWQTTTYVTKYGQSTSTTINNNTSDMSTNTALSMLNDSYAIEVVQPATNNLATATYSGGRPNNTTYWVNGHCKFDMSAAINRLRFTSNQNLTGKIVIVPTIKR